MLLTSEIERCKAELGYNLLGIGAPYIGTTALFELAVQPYLSAGAKTTSSTSVTGDGTPKPIMLADATGFSEGDHVVLDVDGRQERVTVQALSGATLTALFTGTHSGTYWVTVEGGESIVREKLLACVRVGAAVATSAAQSLGTLKRADDVEWYPVGESTQSTSSQMREDLMTARDELAAVLGVPNLWRVKQGAAQRLSAY